MPLSHSNRRHDLSMGEMETKEHCEGLEVVERLLRSRADSEEHHRTLSETQELTQPAWSLVDNGIKKTE